MQAVYVVGGAGTGKSTFTQSIIDEVGWTLGPHQDFWTTRNKAGRPEILRGHELLWEGSPNGFYLGRMRDEFPGTDGLSRSTVIAGEAWLRAGGLDGLPQCLLGEGATFSTVGFLTALHLHSDLVLVHLHASPEVVDLRCLARGSSQDPSFMVATVTRSRNNADLIRRLGGAVLEVDSGNPDALDLARELSIMHLNGEYIVT